MQGLDLPQPALDRLPPVCYTSSRTYIYKDLKGLLPLLILTQGGATHEVVEEVINKLVAAKQQELLPVTKLLSSLAFESEDDQEWLTRRFHQMQDILRETRAYQEIIQEGKLEALHDALLKIVRERFPEMIEVMQKQIGGVVNPTTLEDLLVNISLAQNLQEALRALIALDKGEKKN
jgi:hypothetical protein